MLELKNIYKTYTSQNGVSYRALENISLKFAQTGMVFILGKSGSGKSTLLNMIGNLDNFDRGEIYQNDKKFSSFTAKDEDYYHNKDIGFVFQDFCLLDSLNVIQNVALALSLQNKKDNNAVFEALKKVGIEKYKNKNVKDLSGGIKQKVAIARAIVKKPSIILADEPTGALDSESSLEIMTLLKDLSKNHLIIIVTHNQDLAYKFADRIIEIRDGFVLKDIEKKENKEANEKTTIYSSSLIFVPKDKQIDKETLDEINSIISLKRKDYYFLIEQNKNRVVSLYPNLKEVFIHDDDTSKYIPYELNNKTNDKENTKEKLFLPFNSSIKLSFSFLKNRIGKLLLSIFITIFIVVIIGALSNFATYSFSSAITASIKNSDYNYLDVSSCFTKSDSNYRIQKKDIDTINNYNFEYATRYDYQLKINGINNSDSLFPGGNFKGFIVSDNPTNLGIKFLYKKDNITNDEKINGVYISDIVANSYLKYYPTYSNIQNLVGNYFTVSGKKYQILGIFDGNYEKYKNLNSQVTTSLNEKYTKEANNLYLRLIVNNDFMNNFLATKTSFTHKNDNINCVIQSLSNADQNVGINSNVSNINSYQIDTASYAEIAFYDDNGNKKLCSNSTEFNEFIENLKDNEVIVARDLLTAILNINKYSEVTTELINKFNSSNHLLKVTMYDDTSTDEESYFETYYISNVKIKGVIVPTNSRRDKTIYLKNSEYSKLTQNYFCPTSLLINIDSNKDIVETLYNNGFVINNDFVNDVSKLSTTIEKYAPFIKIILISWIIIGTILFYSFISKSIKDSKRPIGILKALGASKFDISKIFMAETIFISSLSIIIAIILYCNAGLLFNKIMSSKMFSFYFPYFIINKATILAMVIPTLLAYAVSLFISLQKVTKIKPIDVMNRE